VAGICEGRVAIVTGAGRGIGREHALMLASEGAAVVVNDLGAQPDGTGADPGPANEVVAEIEAMGGRAVVNGADVTDMKISLAQNQEADARIVLTNRVSVIEGTVLAGDRPTAAEVIVFTADASRWTFPSRFVRTASADEKGRFRITGLPPSEGYLAVAADYLEDGEHFDPEFLERMRGAATPFSLEDRDTRALELKVLER